MKLSQKTKSGLRAGAVMTAFGLATWAMANLPLAPTSAEATPRQPLQTGCVYDVTVSGPSDPAKGVYPEVISVKPAKGFPCPAS